MVNQILEVPEVFAQLVSPAVNLSNQVVKHYRVAHLFLPLLMAKLVSSLVQLTVDFCLQGLEKQSDVPLMVRAFDYLFIGDAGCMDTLKELEYQLLALTDILDILRGLAG